MGLSLVSLTAAQRGCESNETGINLNTFEVRYYFEVRAKLQNYQGQTRGFAIADKFSRELRIQGEVDGTTGVMAVVGNAAFSPTNDVSTWVAVTSGSNAGGFYLVEATESQSRDGWRSVNCQFESDPLVT